jgi:predicted Zn-ribbon and HTH transcriptional regulator
MKKLTIEEVNQKLKDNSIPYVCTKYNGRDEHSEFYCEEHDHYFEASLTNVLRGKSWCLWNSEWKQTSWTKDLINATLKENNSPHILIEEYINMRSKLKFSCPENHVFERTVQDVLKGKCKCPFCFGQDYKTDQFNSKLNDKNILYKLIGNYITNSTPSLFYCETHGEFTAKPKDVLCGHKCCVGCQDDNGIVLKHTKDSFNAKLESKNVPYRLVDEEFSVKNRAEFYCTECGGYFNATPDNISSGHTKCPHCFKLDLLHNFLTNLDDKNIKYKLVGVYSNSQTETTFYCEEHDYCFEATPNGILSGKYKCLHCHTRTFWTLESVNQHLTDNNRNLVFHEFARVDEKATCECINCGYVWNPKPTSVIHENSGCPKCADYSFDNNKPSIMYYIKFNVEDTTYYKIGITTRTIKKRLNGEGIKYEILFSLNFDTGKEAKLKETELLKFHNDLKYIGPKLLNKTGNTEIFIKDIFDGIYDFKLF